MRHGSSRFHRRRRELEFKPGPPNLSPVSTDAPMNVPASEMIARADLRELLRQQPQREGRRGLLLSSPSTGRRYYLVRWERDGVIRLFGPLPTYGCAWVPGAESVEGDLIPSLQASAWSR